MLTWARAFAARTAADSELLDVEAELGCVSGQVLGRQRVLVVQEMIMHLPEPGLASGCFGYPVLREMRELSTLSAILRDGHADAAARRELGIRLRSLPHWRRPDLDVLLTG